MIIEIRKKYPQYEDLSDQELADGLYNQFYSDMDRAEFDTKIGLAHATDTAISDVPEVNERSWAGVGQDLGASFASGANALLKIGGDLYGLTTGDFDNFASEQGEIGQEYWNARKTDTLKAEEELRKQKINAADGQLKKAGVAFWETMTSPTLLSSFLFEQAPMLLPVAGVGRTAAAGTKLVGAGTKTAATAGTGAAVGAGAAMQGADAGSQAYEQLLAIPDEVWEASTDIQTKLNSGVELDQAKKDTALDLSQNAAIASAVVSGVTNLLPGARYLEKVLAGSKLPGVSRLASVATGFVGESVQEGLEEGSGALSANIAAKQIDPSQETLEGVGEATGLGAAAGPFGAVAGATGQLAGPEGDIEGQLNAELDRINNSGFVVTAEEVARDALDPGRAQVTMVEAIEAVTQAPTVNEAIDAAAQQLDRTPSVAGITGPVTIEGAIDTAQASLKQQEINAAYDQLEAEKVIEGRPVSEAQQAFDQATQPTELGYVATKTKGKAERSKKQAEKARVQAYLANQEDPINPAMADALMAAGFSVPTETKTVESLAGEDGEIISNEAGQIDLKVKNVDAAPESYPSVINFVIDEDKRGQGLGKKLFEEALAKHPHLQGQFSSKESVSIAYNSGLRNPQLKEGSLEDHLSRMNADSSVYMNTGKRVEQLPMPDRSDPQFEDKNVLRQLKNTLAGETHPSGRPMMPQEIEAMRTSISELEAKIEQEKRVEPVAGFNDTGIPHPSVEEQRVKNAEILGLTKKPLTAIDPAKDTLKQAVIKYGGIKRDEVTKDGVDVKDIAYNRMFRVNTGLSLDEMTEALAQDGYLDLDENGKADPRQLRVLLDKEIAGEPVYSKQAELDVEKEAESYYSEEKEFVEPLSDQEAAAFEEVPLESIKIKEDFETEDGGTVQLVRPADKVMAEVDGRINDIKTLIGCLGA